MVVLDPLIRTLTSDFLFTPYLNLPLSNGYTLRCYILNYVIVPKVLYHVPKVIRRFYRGSLNLFHFQVDVIHFISYTVYCLPPYFSEFFHPYDLIYVTQFWSFG